MTKVRKYGDLERIGTHGFERYLEEKLDTIKEELHASHNQDTRRQCRDREAYADRLRQRALKLPFERSVFIAYSGSGDEFYHLARGFFSSRGYRVEAGKVHYRSKRISKNVVDAIEKSRFFLAIWSFGYLVTKTFGAEVETGEPTWIPSMWMPFELATAITLGKEKEILFVRDSQFHESRDIHTRMLGDDQRIELTRETAQETLGIVFQRFEKHIKESQPYRF